MMDWDRRPRLFGKPLTRRPPLVLPHGRIRNSSRSSPTSTTGKSRSRSNPGDGGGRSAPPRFPMLDSRSSSARAGYDQIAVPCAWPIPRPTARPTTHLIDAPVHVAVILLGLPQPGGPASRAACRRCGSGSRCSNLRQRLLGDRRRLCYPRPQQGGSSRGCPRTAYRCPGPPCSAAIRTGAGGISAKTDRGSGPLLEVS